MIAPEKQRVGHGSRGLDGVIAGRDGTALGEKRWAEHQRHENEKNFMVVRIGLRPGFEVHRRSGDPL